MRLILTLMAVSLLSANVAEAAGGCGTLACKIKSHSCRNCDAKTCQIVCEMAKVKKTVWVVECEEFCPMLPGCRPKACRTDCGPDCIEGLECGNGCGTDRCGKDPCEALKNRTYVTPKCGKTRSRKKLVKKEVTCEVPVYKCVVANRCSACGPGEAQPVPTKGTPQKSVKAAPLPPVMSGGR